MNATTAIKVSARMMWNATFPWGSGHTIETDPTKRGWRMVAISEHLAVIGQKGVPGCISVMPLGRNELDVAIYDELKPEELDRQLREGTVYADLFRQTTIHSGWALQFIEEIEAYRQEAQ